MLGLETRGIIGMRVFSLSPVKCHEDVDIVASNPYIKSGKARKI